MSSCRSGGQGACPGGTAARRRRAGALRRAASSRVLISTITMSAPASSRSAISISCQQLAPVATRPATTSRPARGVPAALAGDRGGRCRVKDRVKDHDHPSPTVGRRPPRIRGRAPAAARRRPARAPGRAGWRRARRGGRRRPTPPPTRPPGPRRLPAARGRRGRDGCRLGERRDRDGCAPGPLPKCPGTTPDWVLGRSRRGLPPGV
jgi:hypothetical protein